MKLRIVNYVLNDDLKKRKQIGVISQEAAKVFPSLVEEDKDGFLEFKYSVLVPILVKALQELTDQVEELRGRLPA